MEPQKPEHSQLKSYFTQDQNHYTFYFDITSQELPLRVNIQIQSKTLLEDVLPVAIQQANQQLASKHIKLSQEIGLYKVRLTGKDFRPKTDLPAMSLLQKICDLKVENFAVQIINKEKAISKTNNLKQQSQSLDTKKEDLPAKETPPVAEFQSLNLKDKEEEPQALKKS